MTTWTDLKAFIKMETRTRIYIENQYCVSVYEKKMRWKHDND